MIKNYWRIFFALVIFVSLSNVSKAEDEFVTRDLQQLHDDQVSKDLRDVFNDYLDLEDIDESEKITEDQLELFQEKFLVLQIHQYDKGHYLIDILIDPHQIHCWSVEITRKSPRDDYKILEIKEFSIKKKSRKEFKEFVNKENRGYWQ
jgi:hypothetical protein